MHKIAFVISSLHIGGSSDVCANLACSLPKKDWSVTVISIWDMVDQKYKDLLSDSGVKLVTCNKKSLLDFGVKRRLRAIVENGNFDLISSHLTAVAYLYGIENSVPIVHTIHTLPKIDIPFYYRPFVKRMIKRGRLHMVACSNSIANVSKNTYGDKVFAISNGTSLRFHDSTEGEACGAYTFLYVGRFVEMKRIDLLIRCFARLCEEFEDLSLCLCGDGPAKEGLETLIKKIGLKNVYMPGNVSDVEAYYRKSKVFCLFSEYEGGPICLLEAISQNKILVCSDNEGNLNYAVKDKNAYIFATNDFEDACNAMKKSLVGKIDRETITNTNKRILLENSFDNMVDKYDQFFKRIIIER